MQCNVAQVSNAIINAQSLQGLNIPMVHFKLPFIITRIQMQKCKLDNGTMLLARRKTTQTIFVFLTFQKGILRRLKEKLGRLFHLDG